MDGVFDKGYGSVAERNFPPPRDLHRRTPDGRFVMSVDNGIDQVKIYRFNERRDSADTGGRHPLRIGVCAQAFPLQLRRPLHLSDVRVKNVIDVFTYKTGERAP